MTTEVWVKPHTSGGCQARYYLEQSPKIPFPNVDCSHSVPVILKTAAGALVISSRRPVLSAAYRTRFACMRFRNAHNLDAEYLRFVFYLAHELSEGPLVQFLIEVIVAVCAFSYVRNVSDDNGAYVLLHA